MNAEQLQPILLKKSIYDMYLASLAVAASVGINSAVEMRGAVLGMNPS